MTSDDIMEIHPLLGVGSIEFGMTRDEVERALGTQPQRLWRGPMGTGEPYDLFEDKHLMVYYVEGRCAALEFSNRANIVCDGASLFRMSARAVREWARSRVGTLDDETCGFSSKDLGIGIDAPWIDEDDDDLRDSGDDPHAPPESIIVFARGYYDGATPKAVRRSEEVKP